MPIFPPGSSDYTFGSASTMFVAGSMIDNFVCISVSLVDDDILEEDGEMFSAILSSDNARVGSLTSTLVTINDNDGESHNYNYIIYTTAI